MNYREQVLARYKFRRAEGHWPDQALRIARHDAKYGEHSPKRHVLPSQYEAYEEEQNNKLPNGWYWKILFKYDSNHERPEDWDDGQGVTYIKRGYDYPDEHEREWLLWSERYDWLIYDFKASLEKALKQGWNCPPYHEGTKLERAVRAVRENYDYLRRFYNQHWWYVGMIVELYDEDDTLLDEESCWGYESDCMDYLCEEARSWAASMIKKERRSRREERHAARVAARFNNAMECGL